MTGLRLEVLHQLGFALKRANRWNQPLAARLYIAILGPTDNGGDIEGLRLSVEKRLVEIFRICIQSRVFYNAVSSSEIFWKFASEHWDTFEHVDSNEVAAFVETYRVARESCEPGAQTGELSDVVDEFIKMHKKMIARGPARRSRTILRPAKFSPASIGSPVAGNSDPADTQWPPSHFTEQEIVWFSHDHILSQVYSVTSNTNITKAAEIPRVPDAYTHPLDIRLFLAFTALVNFRRDRKISLCMAPVTFWDDDERRDWYLATGGASKFCWTTWEFCQWAKDEFRRGREAVVGLSHFHCIAEEESWEWFEDTFNPAKHKRRDLGNDSYEFIMEDAHYHRVSSDPAYYEDNFGVYSDSGMDFKSALLQDVVSHFNVTSFWHGGEVPNAFATFGIGLPDSVSTSCSFVYLAVQDKVPTRDLHQEG
ncbi:hypothetical protein GGR55DRAFT_702857 [Xylaria sp. FL0064]|nr:hypothetical protein GGR55DRAFT_702857 [Xylaria sp. FL0064]